MPTKDRLRFLPRAIRCFQAQTHSNRELLVLDDGAEGAEALIPDDSRIRYVRCGRAASLGAKRNLACELARGEYIAHWDDDDWSHPSRLAQQIAGGPTVTGYRRMLFWDEGKLRARLYTGTPSYALGTSLVYRRDWWKLHPFSGIDIGEDNAFVRAARSMLTVQDGYGLMVATTHANGTSPRGTGNKRWSEVDRAAIPEDYWKL